MIKIKIKAKKQKNFYPELLKQDDLAIYKIYNKFKIQFIINIIRKIFFFYRVMRI